MGASLSVLALTAGLGCGQPDLLIQKSPPAFILTYSYKNPPPAFIGELSLPRMIVTEVRSSLRIANQGSSNSNFPSASVFWNSPEGRTFFIDSF